MNKENISTYIPDKAASLVRRLDRRDRWLERIGTGQFKKGRPLEKSIKLSQQQVNELAKSRLKVEPIVKIIIPKEEVDRKVDKVTQDVSASKEKLERELGQVDPYLLSTRNFLNEYQQRHRRLRQSQRLNHRGELPEEGFIREDEEFRTFATLRDKLSLNEGIARIENIRRGISTAEGLKVLEPTEPVEIPLEILGKFEDKAKQFAQLISLTSSYKPVTDEQLLNEIYPELIKLPLRRGYYAAHKKLLDLVNRNRKKFVESGLGIIRVTKTRESSGGYFLTRLKEEDIKTMLEKKELSYQCPNGKVVKGELARLYKTTEGITEENALTLNQIGELMYPDIPRYQAKSRVSNHMQQAYRYSDQTGIDIVMLGGSHSSKRGSQVKYYSRRKESISKE